MDGLTQTYERNQYRNSLYGERPVQDKERFAGLKPVKATVTAQPEETKEISDLLMGIFFEDINYSADGGPVCRTDPEPGLRIRAVRP